MKILVIGFLHKKYDKRVYRTVKALSKLGSVIYIYWTNKKNEKITKQENIEFVPIYHEVNKKNPIKEFLKRREHEKIIIDYIKEKKVDIAYLHHFATTLPLKPYKILKYQNSNLITDFHEYVPEEFLFGVKVIPRKIKEAIGKYLYRKMLMFSDGAVFVSKEIEKNALKQESDIEHFWFPNYGSLKISPISREKRNKEIIFVGVINRNLDKEKVILQKLRKKGFEFTTVGTENYLDFATHQIPFLKYNEMIERISKAAFSIISFNVTDPKNRELLNYVHSLPNKFFDSLSAGTPVIVDYRLKDMAEIVSVDNTGIVIDRDNFVESVKRIDNIWTDKVHYENLLKNIKDNQNSYIWNEEKVNDFINFIKNCCLIGGK